MGLIGYIRRHIYLCVARRKGKKSGRLEQPPARSGAGEEQSNVPDSLLALDAIIDREIERYLRAMASIRERAWEVIDGALDRISEIDALEPQVRPVFPVRLPVWKDRWFFVGLLLFAAAMEGVLIVSALRAVSDYAGPARWLLAFAVGMLITLGIVLMAGRTLAFVLGSPDLRDVVRYRPLWLVMVLFAFLLVVVILLLPYVFTIYRQEAADALAAVANFVKQAEEPSGGLADVSTAGQPADDGSQTSGADVSWSFWLQEGALLADLVCATFWYLGARYRRYEKDVVGGLYGIARSVTLARKVLVTLARRDEETLWIKLAEGDERRHEYGAARQAVATRAGMPRLEEIPLPDHSGRIARFYLITKTRLPDLERQVEEIQHQVRVRLERIGQLGSGDEPRAIE